MLRQDSSLRLDGYNILVSSKTISALVYEMNNLNIKCIFENNEYCK